VPGRLREAGVSLIEVLLVLAIVGILAGVATYSLSSSRAGASYINAVVAVTDQVEATLYAAQRASTLSLAMVDVQVSGSWENKDFRMTYTGAAAADDLRYVPKIPEFLKAGVEPTQDKWPSELGEKPAFKDDVPLAKDLLAAMDQPLQGLSGGKVTISGTTRTFNTPFYIAVVPYGNDGKPMYSGQAGLLVVRGHMIFKYLRPEKDKPWRRA